MRYQSVVQKITAAIRTSSAPDNAQPETRKVWKPTDKKALEIRTFSELQKFYLRGRQVDHFSETWRRLFSKKEPAIFLREIQTEFLGHILSARQREKKAV